MAPELAFVLAPGQNLFFVELVAALRDELARLNMRTTVHEGRFPAPRADRVYVLVPPHEYLSLSHGRRPTAEVLARTIFICAEQPGTSHFEENLQLAPKGGAVFDINRESVAHFAAAGLSAQHIQLGWTQSWDCGGPGERDIDVLFMGCISPRRGRALASYSAELWPRRTCYVLSDNSAPNFAASRSFRAGEEKWDLLKRSKVVLNIHQGEPRYFEWLRIVQAITAGAVVVSEHSTAHLPLKPGKHFLSGSMDSLGMLAALALDDSELRGRIQSDALRTLQEKLPLRDGALALAAAAETVAGRAPVPDAGEPFFHQAAMTIENARLPSRDRPTLDPAVATGEMVPRAIKQIRLEQLALRRQIDALRLAIEHGGQPSPLELIARTRAYLRRRPRVSVLMALYNHEAHVVGALDSLLGSWERDWEVIVVDDGSGDRSQLAVHDWCAQHEEVAATVLAHPVNSGLAAARNSALGWARGQFCFVLDADNEILPHCLERLLAALDADPGAAFAYGLHERFTTRASTGLVNMFPWEPWRFRYGNFIDAMALIRTDALRRLHGYGTDPRLHGWEDFDLWCRMADAGDHGVLVPEILARYRSSEHSMLSLTNISDIEAMSLIQERSPAVMALDGGG